MKIAKVNFNLISNQRTNKKKYYFNTDIEGLEKGDILVVDSQGKEQYANFLGYYEGQREASKNVIRKAAIEELTNYWTMVEDNLLKYPLYISDEIYNQYQYKFNNNFSTSKEEATLKLTRNVLLSNNFTKGKIVKNNHVFNYGTQEITVKGNEIVLVGIDKTNVEFNISEERRKYIESKLNLIAFSEYNSEHYKIKPPTKEELTSKGFTNRIKIKSNQTVESLMEYGFSNHHEPTLYFFSMLIDDISFGISVDKKSLVIKNIDVLDENFLQPYDYQRILMNDMNHKYARMVFDKVDVVLNKLQNDGLIEGYLRGMYI
ncbi:hypothetical protein [Lysinibacillus sp. Bpr_S20]|uniref:hypothetical protein n=1 Tax=Lysinibacillus sp. Bpr_S20 TaxID=2933964 RepID=UPI0020110039|nr:hypothetical protein [Lysinibacillus sp. Bpr_S20]MCL1700767.1 hypothetical protein [Lysinibacillus sp. Bpr_S20]